MQQENIACDVLVIGSGPGGAVSAYLAACAGLNVCLVEEGANIPLGSTQAYSLDEMNQKYRHGGVSAALGRTKTVYLEARCVGGASEINAGLYHAPMNETLSQWRDHYGIRDFSDQDLKVFFQENEKDISVSCIPYGPGPASRKLKLGADSLGWDNAEVPRAWKYTKKSDGTWNETRQTMTQTLIPKAVKKGVQLIDRAHIKRLVVRNKKACLALGKRNQDGEWKNFAVSFKYVFVCCGAIQTPLLLRRSGVKRNIGNTLRMHPAVRMVAVFDEDVYDSKEGVPVVQVKEFKPATTLGGSFGGLPHLAMWLSGKEGLEERLKASEKMAMYYALVTGSGLGRVRNIPFIDEPLVRLPVTDKDLQRLGEGLYNLGKLLFAAGARELHIPVRGSQPIKSINDLNGLKKGLPAGKTDISTIHLFCSCPMGEDIAKCAVDSYGKLHGFRNIYLNDSSILPGTPGVNPQATIMAIARRNISFFLKSL